MSTKLSTANLAVRQHHSRLDPRMAMRRLCVAFIGIVHGAKKMPATWYELTRKDRVVHFPFERERTFVHAAIREGATTPEKVVAWRMAQILDDLAQFRAAPSAQELIYVNVIREQVEAIDAQSKAHAHPNETHRDRAIRETEESIAALQLYLSLLRSGASLEFLPA